jgi:L,D-transpeptidase YcbB
MKRLGFFPCLMGVAGVSSLVLPAATGFAASPQIEAVSAAAAGFRDGIDLIAADMTSEGRPSGATLKPAAVFQVPGGSRGGVAPSSAHPLIAQLRDGLADYRSSWGALPQIHVPAGAPMRTGQRGERVRLLRERLGLPEADRFDGALAAAVSEYRRVHALGESGIADAALIASLNRGTGYYEQIILLNIERLRALPSQPASRYILVDAAAARLWLYENDRARDSMKVVVGKIDSPTPMLATHIRWAELSPYWNVPPDLARKLIAPRVLGEGIGYLAKHRYQVLADWTDDATVVDPNTVDWHAVAAGRAQIRVRQQPGGANAMGAIKFMMRNDFGIYLHDTPNRELFAQGNRWQSNGCVRVEDAERLAKWVFEGAPRASGALGEVLPIAKPVPVYITYLTAELSGSGQIVFRADPYGRDSSAMARWLAPKDRLQTASRSMSTL